MPANKRSNLLAELTDIPAKPKRKTTKNPAKAQQATSRLNRLSQTKKTKQEKRQELIKAHKDEIEVIRSETKVVQAEVLNVMGRPTDYTPELAEEICTRIASGESMRSVSRSEGMPAMQTMFRWLRLHKDFSDHYARATIERTEAFQEDILDISDDGHNDWMEANYGNTSVWITNGEALQRSRLRVETRKWLMERMKPKKYGAKLDVTSDGKAMPIALLGGASDNPNIINDVKTPEIEGGVSENAA